MVLAQERHEEGRRDSALRNLSVHARTLAAHLVYGVTAEGVRRLLRRAF
jgi:hypothetical protein